MKKISILFLLFAFLSCDDEEIKNETGSIKVVFSLKYGDQDLKMFEEYSYPTGEKLYFSRFAMFSDYIDLQNPDNTYYNIDGIKYHDLTNSHTGNGTEYSYTIDNVKVGTYGRVRMGIGVSEEDNSKTPANFNPPNPLSNQSEYWGGWQSYIFTRTEGKIDFNGDLTPETGFALHTGADTAHGNFDTFLTDFSVKANQTTNLTIEIDLKKQFGVLPFYDIKANPQIHSLSQQPQVRELMTNLLSGITIK